MILDISWISWFTYIANLIMLYILSNLYWSTIIFIIIKSDQISFYWSVKCACISIKFRKIIYNLRHVALRMK